VSGHALALAAATYIVFALLVHNPAPPASHPNWAENAINLLLVGTTRTLADARKGRRESNGSTGAPPILAR
jgi:hypothetical protein